MGDATLVGGRYELVRLVGSGAMGEVHEAIDRETKRRVAVKRIKLDQRVPDDVLVRFDREVRATAQITSRHVVSIHDAGRDDDEPYMVMDYLEGEDLGLVLDRIRIVPIDLALRIAAQTCDGLVAAHAAGIIHRDIKPTNLFVTAPTASSSRLVKILDFGIARMRMSTAELDATELTRTGAIVGSPLFMAPEQLRGLKDLDGRADVWSLGVVLYRMLCGAVPQSRESIGDLIVSVCSTPAPPLRERAPWIPNELARLVHSALAIEPSLRISSARAFADELARWLPHGSAITSDMLDHDGGAPELAPVEPDPLSGSDVDPALMSGEVVAPRGVARSAAISSIAHVASPRAEATRVVRPTLLVALGIAGAIAVGVLVYWKLHGGPDEPEITEASSEALPPELASTDGGVWFAKVRDRCNAMQIRSMLAETPPPKSRDGVAFHAACAALAGDFKMARYQLNSIDKDQRAYGSWPTFEIAHHMADLHPADPAVARIMRLVLEMWPTNYMALYHAGMAEAAAKDPRGRDHLRAFLRTYTKHDAFTANAERTLASLGP